MTPEEGPARASPARVIKAKVRPPVTEGWVERARPEAVLADALEARRVVVVSATAGSGKTTLVAAVTERLQRPSAWLTLDWTDTAPGRLVTYLEEALNLAVPRIRGGSARRRAQPHGNSSTSSGVGPARGTQALDREPRGGRERRGLEPATSGVTEPGSPG